MRTREEQNMKSRWTLVVCVVVAAAGVAAETAGADVSQTPVATGCPAGFSLFTVGTPPYKVPGQLDNPANGGNGDGLVCAHAFPDAVRDAFCATGRGGCLLEQLGLPLYEFAEDNNPAQGATAAILDLGS
jgi:hypothetical protein